MTVREAVQRTELAKVSDPGRALEEAADAGKIKASTILRSVGIDNTNPVHQAALLAAQKYGLDPLLKHIIVIQGSGLYVTRDGWLAVAHRSGEFDGMSVEDTGVEPDHWWARVAVYRKDMGRPFSYVGRYPKKGGNAKYGPEMAVKVAEVAALRRAFPIEVQGIQGAYEERWDTHDPYEEAEPGLEDEPEPMEDTPTLPVED